MIDRRCKMPVRLDNVGVTVTAISGIIVNFSRPIVSLLTLPLLLSGLGQDGLGVWLVIASIMGMLGLVSTAITTSMVTRIGRITNDYGNISLFRTVTALSIISVGCSSILLIVFLPLAFIVDWISLFNVTGQFENSALSYFFATQLLSLATGILTNVPRPVILGRMHGYIANFLDLMGTLLGSVLMIFTLSLGSELWIVGLAASLPPHLVFFVGGVLYFKKTQLPFFSFSYLHRPILLTLTRECIQFFWYQGAYAVSSQSDVFLIGLIFGTSSSATYGIAQKVFSVPILLVNAVNTAQWPAIANADAHGRKQHLRAKFTTTLTICFTFSTTIAIITAAFYERLVVVWMDGSMLPDLWLLAGMVAWVSVATLVISCDILLRAIGEGAYLFKSMLLMAIANIVLSLLLLHIIGEAGVIWGSVIGYSVFLLVPYSLKIYYDLSKQGLSR